jgi:hypothetical protein
VLQPRGALPTASPATAKRAWHIWRETASVEVGRGCAVGPYVLLVNAGSGTPRQRRSALPAGRNLLSVARSCAARARRPIAPTTLTRLVRFLPMPFGGLPGVPQQPWVGSRTGALCALAIVTRQVARTKTPARDRPGRRGLTICNCRKKPFGLNVPAWARLCSQLFVLACLGLFPRERQRFQKRP